MEALKRLGHEKLKLNEYESASTYYMLIVFYILMSFQSESLPRLSIQMISISLSQVRPWRMVPEYSRLEHLR